MVKRILMAAAVLLAGTAYAQPTPLRIPPKYTVATAPACVDGEPKLFAVTDGSSSTDCTVGGGSTEVICKCTDGTAAAVGSGGGGSSNSFETINAPSGTDPVADSSTDTLNITCAGGLTCTGNSATDTLDLTMGTASAATALASDPSDCAANQFANAIAASGNLTCAAISDADVPDGITVTLAGTATALAANGANCSAGQYPLGVDASGAVESCTADDTGTDDQTATEVSYTPTTGTDWTDPDPASAGEGLDDLAARLTVEEAKADDDVPESGDFGAATDLDADGSVSANAVALGTDTTGNYVAGATASQGLALTGTEAGTLGLTTCTDGQILKNSGGTSWACAADATGSGIVGSTGATDERLLRADGTGGSTLQAGSALHLNDSGQLYGSSSTQGLVSVSSVGISVANAEGTGGSVVVLGSAWSTPGLYRNGDITIAIEDSAVQSIYLGRSGTTPKVYARGPVLSRVLVEANTAGSGTPNAITDIESGTVFTNEGVTAKNFHTLPSAVAGYVYEFAVQDADGMRITANTGDTIEVNGNVTAAAGYIESTAIGSKVRLLAINATEWMAMGVRGTWTDGTFTTAGIGGSTGATDNAILRADGTGGATVQASALTIADTTGAITFPTAASTTALIKLGSGASDPSIGTHASIETSGVHFFDASLGGWIPIVASKLVLSGAGSLQSGGGSGVFTAVNDNGFRVIDVADTGYTPLKSSELHIYGTNYVTTPDLGITRSAAGVARVSDGSTGLGNLLSGVLVEANTAGSGTPNAIAANESGTVFTNEGTTAKNYHTLPTAAAGYQFTFVVQDADGLRVTAAAGDDIRIGATTSTTAGYCESTTVGDSVTLVAINATSYYAVALIGSGWTCAILFPAFGVRRRLRDLIAANDNL